MVMPIEKEKEEVQAVCSKCFTSMPLASTHVQPGYNDLLKAYVTTYRCDACRSADLAATRARMAACKDKPELATAVVFFSRYNVTVHGLSPYTPLEMMREKLLTIMDRLESGDLRIRIDPATAVSVNLPDGPLDLEAIRKGMQGE